MNDATLTWAWCVATYKRHAMLARALGHVLTQTRPPAEAIVVDASDNWAEGRDLLAAVVERHRDRLPPGFVLHYLPAPRPSSAVQRNVAIDLATADVLFLIDDDTLLYPDCAEKVMQVYEADTQARIQAVVPARLKQPPPPPETDPSAPATSRNTTDAPSAPQPTDPSVSSAKAKQYGWLASRVRGVLRADDLFVPYDAAFPDLPVPAEVAGRFNIPSRRLVAGYCLTCRRTSAQAVGFEARLERYCPGEDSDMTYRLARQGPLVCRLDAHLCHLEAQGGRLNHYPRVALGAINPLLMHRVHSTDLARSKKAMRVLLRRRFLIELTKDVQNRSLSLPRARGILTALRASGPILDCPDDRIDETFARYQRLALR